MNSPSVMPAVKVLVSQITLMVGPLALNGRKRHELAKYRTASIAETVPSLGSKDPQIRPTDLIAVTRMCVINVRKDFWAGRELVQVVSLV
jgi:hypothetical protein